MAYLPGVVGRIGLERENQETFEVSGKATMLQFLTTY